MYCIIGANGFLGSYIIKSILKKTNENIVACCRDISLVGDSLKDERITWRSLDICDFKAVSSFCKEYNRENKKVVYLAAYHNPDLVEKNPKTAWNTNIISLSFFINEMDNVSAFYYPSSDSVYGNSIDGKVFEEDDDTNPVNTYGKQKALAERIVTTYGYQVVRYPFLIGTSLLSSKKHFYDHIVESLKSKVGMDMFSDSYRSTISFKQAADYIVELIEMNDKHPIVNISSDKALSKYEVGLIIAKKLGLDESLVRPVKVEDSEGIFVAKRASSTMMDNKLLKSIFDVDEIRLEI
ncbi:MAG: NAD-dependent epimerase/dehydratase family protein [Lachnospiraceae bacterium]|jgi:hypothetical dTDP-4-dehydrorhamnose reductase|nr:MAG: NAD-dependent epimerase/dehydratase family protein [Lachnospiraceae bacterium]